jgi:hypothetical protein
VTSAGAAGGGAEVAEPDGVMEGVLDGAVDGVLDGGRGVVVEAPATGGAGLVVAGRGLVGGGAGGGALSALRVGSGVAGGPDGDPSAADVPPDVPPDVLGDVPVGVPSEEDDLSAALLCPPGPVLAVAPGASGGVAGRPSTPMTTGEVTSDDVAAGDDVADEPSPTAGAPAPEPETTGRASTRAATVGVRSAASTRRLVRVAVARRPSARTPRRAAPSAPDSRARKGGPEGLWCTESLSGVVITFRYREETKRVGYVTDSPCGR